MSLTPLVSHFNADYSNKPKLQQQLLRPALIEDTGESNKLSLFSSDPQTAASKT